MLLLRLLLVGVILIGGLFGSPRPAPAKPAGNAGTALELAEVGHALQGRTLVVSGWVRNAGSGPVDRLVIDVTAFAPNGDLAGFGSDGIPWIIPPNGLERFQIFLPLGGALVRDYAVTIFASRPGPLRPAAVTRTVDPALYRSLLQSMVRVRADTEATSLVLRVGAEGLPVMGVRVKVILLLQDKDRVDLRSIIVAVPVDRAVRLPFTPLIVRVVSVEVVDVTITPTW